MARHTFLVAVAVLALSFFVVSRPDAQRSAEQIRDDMLRAFDPHLLIRAEQEGIYDRAVLPVFREMNPFYLRGDFNGDGGMDVAFWVTDSLRALRGVAIVHSTLDSLLVFGAGHPLPMSRGNEIRVDAWHLLTAGHIDSHVTGSVPEIGVLDGLAFTFERETLEFVHLGKSAFVLYWANGRYWEFWTAN